MRFAGRLVLGMTVVVVFTIGILVWASEVSLRRDLEADIREALERNALLVREALPADSLGWQRTVRRLASEIGIRVTVIDKTGRVRAESDAYRDDLSSIENHASRPEVQAALHDSMGWDRRASRTVGTPLMYVAVPGGPGVVRVATSLEQVDQIVHRAQRSVLLGALLALLVGCALAFVAGRSIARPLTAIGGAARAIAAGAFPRFPRSGIPDVDALVRALKGMDTELAQRFEELRLARAESEALVEAMVEGVIAADSRGRIATANRAARALLGYEAEDSLPDLPQLFRAKSAREVVDQVMEGKPVRSRELDLDDRVVLMSARPLDAGGAVLVLHDVTEIRRLEAVRRDFVANVSHELKTPLTSLSGYAETLVSDEVDPDTARRFLHVILGSARRMQRLVDGLLDLSRIESGGWIPRREAVRIAAAGREVSVSLTDRAATGGISLVVEPGSDAEVIWADPDALRQILTNLVDNALRYTPPGGRVTVRSRRKGDGVEISVSDTGSGITGEHLPRIFERFYRADPGRSREEGGTGLGLAIVKHLVEAHNGSVSAESELGVGTTIRCWFPIEPIPAGA